MTEPTASPHPPVPCVGGHTAGWKWDSGLDQDSSPLLPLAHTFRQRLPLQHANCKHVEGLSVLTWELRPSTMPSHNPQLSAELFLEVKVGCA